MSRILGFSSTSIGAKVIVAVTGFLLFVYVLFHMAGNLQVFLGPDKLNGYAAFLKSHMALLWMARSGLLVIVLLHIWTTSRLTLANRAARPVPYALKKSREASFTSRNMYVTGAMIFAFVAYHLGQFTLGWTNPSIYGHHDALGRVDVYRMVVMGFQNPFISGCYIVAMVLLGLHLSHGVSSMFQSVGINRPRRNAFVNAVGPTLATVIVLGNLSMPIAILAGLVTL